ncbi:MAG: molybdopterin-guanine dinucleotide biosynthesis protein B [Nitrosomonadales bacterium]|nr:molybdopterin-guanine dinucleotide biosynthesis protein B [Nitrosomonadales bacterium]
MPKVFAFAGHSGSGKTTLIEKLLHELTGRGLRVATIKHSHHALDTQGKDSWRHREAGASASLLLTPSGISLMADSVEQHEPQQLAQHYFPAMDMVLAEGFSSVPGAKIEVLRRECSALPRCAIEDGLIALVTDVAEVYPQLPHFALDDIGGIVRFMLEPK